MKILCCNPDGGAFYYIVEGWANAFRALGHEFKRWDGKRESFQAFKPDLYLGCSGWRQEVPQDLRKAFNTKVGIHVNPWGSIVLKALKGEPNINESPQARRWTISQKPDFVYGYASNSDLMTMWNFWKEKAGLPTVSMPTGGDYISYKKVQPHPAFKCDVGFVGGRWAYKAININKYLVPVLMKFDSQVYGWGGWNKFPKYKGNIDTKNVEKLFSTALVCPSVVEPHTSRYGIDIPERMFKIPLGGGMTILDPIAGIKNYDPDSAFPMARNPAEYLALINHYINNPEERSKKAKEQRELVLKKHTYFSRIQGFMSQCGWAEELEAAKLYVKNIVEKG